ncbi:hypothetical protein A8L34_27730 [Bacillus sp. FJAT-27264]|uniref:hypothetical protein n=1 Tax=Paenibacillus sp. (strain DSM 101736 / FJAT-27264) TaxID=1850362 RepID=UPI000807BB3E|nr:hypothetical protein [Bacillus sp. FJAT-27264]OBZ15842.1 hypothetical protein A8L34_27730 [Bacillus sp. FJAT-27264]
MKDPVLNYGEKAVGSGSDFNIEVPAGVEAPMQLYIEEKGLTVGEYFSEYRKLGLPLNPSHYDQLCEMKPVKICQAQGVDLRVGESVALFEFENGKVLGIPTLVNVLGTKFQKEMIGYLNQQQGEQYNELLKVADRCIRGSDRTLGDVLKYATDALPSNPKGYMAINKQVSRFNVYSYPNGDDVLKVEFKNSRRESTIPLKKIDVTNEQRRGYIDNQSRKNILQRSFTR